jgi:hypothetical protein
MTNQVSDRLDGPGPVVDTLQGADPNRSTQSLSRRGRAIVFFLAVAGFYLILALVALNNLVLHFTRAVPGTIVATDFAVFHWNLWWIKYALLDLHRTPLVTDYLLFPNTSYLVGHHTLSLTLGLLSLPFHSFFSLNVIYNAWMVLSLFLTGLCTFLFLRRLSGSAAAALLGGVIVMVNPIMMLSAWYGHLDRLPMWWMPLCLWLWDIAIERRSWLAAIGVGLAAYLAFLNDLQFALWIGLTLGPLVVYRFVCPPAGDRTVGQSRAKQIGLIAVMGAAILLPSLIVPLPQFLQSPRAGYAPATLDGVQYYSLTPQSLLWRGERNEFDWTTGQLIPLLTLVGLFVRGRRDRQRERWFWLAVGSFLLVLAFGMQLGPIPLPYALLHRLLGEQYRAPFRFVAPASLGLAAFISLSLREWIASLPLRSRVGANRSAIQVLVLAVLMLGCAFDFGFLQPFPVLLPKDYAFYRAIGADTAESTLLEVPLAPYSGFDGFGMVVATRLQYYAQFHHKRLINGAISRMPANALDPYQASPLFRALAGVGPLPPLPQASEELASRVEKWNVRYIVIHREFFDEPTGRHLMQFLNVQPFLCLMAEEYDALAYRVIPWADCSTQDQLAPIPGQRSLGGRIELGQPSSERFVGPGWYWAENVGGPQARWAGESPTSTLRVWLAPGATHVRFHALAYPADERVTISVNGQALADMPLVQDWADYAFDIPEGVIGPEPARIELRHTAFGTPADRPLAAAYQWFEFTSTQER